MGLLDNQTQSAYYNNSTGHGHYQFTSLTDIINNFMIVYVGEEKVIQKVKRTDVSFYAQRALQELSFDTFKSIKSQEIEIPPSLTMLLPQDYVNYVKISWTGTDGLKRTVYPTSKTSNPFAIKQNTDGTYDFGSGTTLKEQDATDHESDTWTNYSTSSNTDDQDLESTYWKNLLGERYGIDPQHAQANGSFFIDELNGRIHFSSNINGKTIILDYISDSLGTDEEMKVHKFAEEAMYKWIMHSIVATKSNMPEYVVARYKKEKRAAIRQAKLRLSNLKLEEITQVLRGKSKHIKH
tara:strand:+ start:981 stop:1865 length:885 start_codon:yes stop_codon:yes gene_type:complete